MDIFENLNKIIISLNEGKKVEINPDAETEEQGKYNLYDKIASYFGMSDQNTGFKPPVDDNFDVPDNFVLDSQMKNKLEKDKTFHQNKLLWDNDDIERIHKELDDDLNMDDGNSGDDDFDDFDYQDNKSGAGMSGDNDDDGMDNDSDEMENGENRYGDEGEQNGGSNGSDSGDQSGLSQRNGQNSNHQSSSSRRQDGMNQGDMRNGNQQSPGQSSSMGGSGQTDSMNNRSSGNTQNSGSSPNHGSTRDSGDSELKDVMNNVLDTLKDKGMLDSNDADKMKDAITSGDGQKFDKAKNDAENKSGEGDLAGELKSEVSDQQLKDAMKDAGVSQNDIDKMIADKNTDTAKTMGDDKLEKMTNDVMKELDDKSGNKSGSALSKVIAKSAVKRTLKNDDWRKLLKIFVKGRSKNGGGALSSNSSTQWGNRNHLWRGAILPTTKYEEATLQDINCLVDFSGSVNQDLVYTFLGNVVDLAIELKYSKVHIYGVADNITKPVDIDKKMINSKGKEVALSYVWNEIIKQIKGQHTTNFEKTAKLMQAISTKDKKSIFIIFGDAEWNWGDVYSSDGTVYLSGLSRQIKDRTCLVIYYFENYYTATAQNCVNYMRNDLHLNVITTEATSIYDK